MQAREEMGHPGPHQPGGCRQLKGGLARASTAEPYGHGLTTSLVADADACKAWHGMT